MQKIEIIIVHKIYVRMTWETPTQNYNRVNLHIVCQVYLHSVDLYTKHFRLLTYDEKSPLQKIEIIIVHKIYVTYNMGNTNPELQSCKSTHSMSNTLTECRFVYETF